MTDPQPTAPDRTGPRPTTVGPTGSDTVDPGLTPDPVGGGTVSLWRNRDYLSWWGGTALSLLGSNVSVIALPLLVLFGGGSALSAGAIAAAERAGALLTRLAGGALADRYSRRAILIAAPLIQAVLMGVVAALVAFGQVLVPLLAGVALTAGLCAGIEASATLPAMRRLVPRTQLAARAAQEQGLQQATQLAGSPLAGLLFGLARWLPFGLDAVSFVAASIGVALIRTPLGPEPAEGAQRGMLADIGDGLRIVARHPFLRYTTGWVAVTNLVGSSVILLGMVLLTQQGNGPGTIGVTNAVVLAGGVTGAVVAGRIVAAVGARRIFLVGNWVYVVSLGLVALTRAPWQLALAAGVFVFASVPTASVWEAYTAAVVPDRLFGRVGATTGFAAQSLTWAGSLLAGLLADRFGARVALLCFAALLVPFSVANHVAPALRVFRTPLAEIPEPAD